MATDNHNSERTPDRHRAGDPARGPFRGAGGGSVRRRDRDELQRLLQGELPAAKAERLRARLAREPELAAALRRMEVTWELLELPPAAPAPPGFAARVAARAAEERRSGAETAPFRPAWARAMAAAALAAGIIAGASVGWLVIPDQTLVVPTGQSAAVTAAQGSMAASGASGASAPAATATASETPDEGTEPATGTETEPGAGATGSDRAADTATTSDGFDSLASSSLPSLAESYWSAFAPEDETGTDGGEALR